MALPAPTATAEREATRPRPAAVLSAFAIVYVVWGSTYLAIRFAVETLPPFLMAGVRFLVAGLALVLWARRRGSAPTTGREWRTAGIAGVLLLFGGNGSLVWAEQRVASGIAALLVATLPVWMVVLDWLRPGGRRPRPGVFAGLALGLVGLALLVGPDVTATSRPTDAGVDLLAAGVLMVGSISWAAGSIYLRHAPPTRNATLSNGMQMLAGGLALGVVGLASGELAHFDTSQVTTRSMVSLLYLAVFGSIVAFSAYTYILRVSTPARVATYAYVNPVVAMLLGWAFANEPITMRTLLAAAVILAGVAIITLTGGSGAGGGTASGPSPSSTPDRRASSPGSRRDRLRVVR